MRRTKAEEDFQLNPRCTFPPCPQQPLMYLYMETFSMRSVVSVSVMMMPFGEMVRVTLRNFLALALA